MLIEMSSSDLQGWLAYYQKEPWGYEIENYRSGIIAASILNANRSKNSDKVYTWKDFFPKHVEKQTPDKQFEIASLICSIYGKEGT